MAPHPSESFLARRLEIIKLPTTTARLINDRLRISVSESSLSDSPSPKPTYWLNI